MADKFEGYIPALIDLGLSEPEARVYVVLLSGPASSDVLAEGLGSPARRVTEILKRLETNGLVKRTAERPLRFALIPPKLTLPALVRKRESEVGDVSRTITELTTRIEDVLTPEQGLLEVVVGRDGLRAQCNSMEVDAEWEILGMMKPPWLISSVEGGNPQEEDALTRRVRTRWLYERTVFEEPGVMNEVRRFARLGEECRVLPKVPAKLLIADRQIALVQVAQRSPSGPRPLGLVTRHEELVRTLTMLFDLLWSQALPVFPGPSEADESGGGDDELLNLLMTGLTDISIARQLGVSQRTIARRIRQLMNSLGTDTRFQAGVKVGSRLIVGPGQEIQ